MFGGQTAVFFLQCSFFNFVLHNFSGDFIQLSGQDVYKRQIYNCGGYESVDSLRMLEGKVQIYLPDFKYVDNQLAIRYSGTADYFEQAGAAIREMVRQTGPRCV